MKVAILAPITWRTPPRKYGPWEQVASAIAEGLVDRDVDVTLFATGDSLTRGTLESVCSSPTGETNGADYKVWECLHISHLMENAHRFDIIHNHLDFLPLSYSGLIATPMLTTIHGFSSEKILPVYKKYAATTSYVSISEADRHKELPYLRTVYNGIDPDAFPFKQEKEDYLLYFGRIHPDKGAHLAIEIARKAGRPLKMAGLIQDQRYYEEHIRRQIESGEVQFFGNAGPALRTSLLENARALLHPICFEEPFGLSVVEAMMSGTPVIAYNRGSMSELIVDGVTGFLTDDISEAVHAVHQIDKIAPRDCRDHAIEHFSQDRMVDSYLEAYEEILSRPAN